MYSLFGFILNFYGTKCIDVLIKIMQNNSELYNMYNVYAFSRYFPSTVYYEVNHLLQAYIYTFLMYI